MALLFYEKEKGMFPEAYERKLSDCQAECIFKRFRNHYKFRQILRFYGYKQGGGCSSSVITISHNPSLGILAHEISHAIKFTKEGRKGRFHSKRHLSIMGRVLKYCDSNVQKWLETADKKAERSRTSFERKMQKRAENEAKKRTVGYRLLSIEKLMKRWETKRKRAENALKRLNRRKKIYQNKVLPKQEAMKIIKEKNCRIERIPEGFEVFAPEGHNFDGEFNSMICFDWDDVMERLKSATIERGEII